MKKLRRLLLALCVGLLALNVGGCMDLTPPYIETTADATIFEDKFYYGQLTEEEQLAYREIYAGVMAQEAEIYIHYINAEDANRILHNVIYDFSLIFWTDGSATSTAYEETLFSDSFTVVEMNYLYDRQERERKEEEILLAAAEVLDSVPAEYGEYEKIKYIYEYLVQHVDYVEGVPDDQNIYSALVGKQTVCAGYAKATQYLLQELGIPCIYVTGMADGEEGEQAHGWNIVRCNGNYYYLDVTWADPLFLEGEVRPGEIIYDYLCCSENVLGATHTLDEGYEYPACTAEDLDYYRLNGMFYETAAKTPLLNAMKTSIRAKEGSTIFKFADDALYAQGKQLLMDQLMNSAAQYLCERYYLQEVEYFYQEYEDMNRFVVYWQYE